MLLTKEDVFSTRAELKEEELFVTKLDYYQVSNVFKSCASFYQTLDCRNEEKKSEIFLFP